MNEECEMPQPSEEHALIQKNIGVWDVKCRFFMGPDAPPMESTATDTVTAAGPFWNIGNFESEFMGMPFTGVSQFGFSPMEGCFVSTWTDCMSPHLFVMKGNFTDDGKTLDMRGEGPNPMSGEMVPQRIEHEIQDDNNHIMRMFMTTEHGEIQTFEMDYTRRP